ncbi:Serine carboxypeptidase-like [Actinidia chinensis var. chinensis]|uniref:Carboxypeptidase n=1 Tax=Actinidia chinensis var. chinensis TaxID=1590841 RepID=A0A2R6RH66_ACTCC|nr:Serine carboxypeptidase-like [Actinidia chinensis var. chinensis]
MEKNHEFFSAKLKQFIPFIIMMALHGISHGYPINQAGQLRALWGAQRQSQGPNVDDMWTVPSLKSGVCSKVGKMEDDLITEGGLPGQPSLYSWSNFKQYAGYVNVDESKGRSLFYYFAEAAYNPSSKPLVLWLNGGPGCSSLGVGAMTEIGPFGVNPDGKTLYRRKHAWNKVANALFLESPAGVGFSYSNTSSDYNMSGDKRTAQDVYTFLINWFRRYPHYKARDFYITGESYAGHYIPELADTIIKGNKEVGPASVIQLKGIMIGNGIMNVDTDTRGSYDYIWSHALISDETHRGLVHHCTSTSFNSPKCVHFTERMSEESGDIDPYNIYGPLCLNSSNSSRRSKRSGGYDPCELDYVQTYLNLPPVQEALHANRTKLPYAWEFCRVVTPDWKDSPPTMFPIYRRLIASGLQILLYSGDVDAVVPVSSTRYSIDALNIKVIKPWHPWSDNTGEVAGYKVVYDGLTFATVRGAGHQVPQHKPRRALTLFKMFITGN